MEAPLGTGPSCQPCTTLAARPMCIGANHCSACACRPWQPPLPLPPLHHFSQPTVSEFWVSSRLLSVGDTLTNMSVLAVPPMESCKAGGGAQGRGGWRATPQQVPNDNFTAPHGNAQHKHSGVCLRKTPPHHPAPRLTDMSMVSLWLR